MGSETVHRLPSIRELRSLVVPSPGSSRWDEGELPQAVLHLDDQTVLLQCEALLGLAVVRRRSIDESPEAKAHALRAIVAALLPKDLDHPYCSALRCLAGLEPGTAGRRREQRQEAAGRALGLDGYLVHPRSVRRRVREDCWAWLFDRLMDQEVQTREALEAEKRELRAEARGPSAALGHDSPTAMTAMLTRGLGHSAQGSNSPAVGVPSCVAGCDRCLVPGGPLTPVLALLQEWLGSPTTDWLADMGPLLWIPLPEDGERFGLSWQPPALPPFPGDSKLDDDMKRRTLLLGLPATWLLSRRSAVVPALSDRAGATRVTEDVLDSLAAAIQTDKRVSDWLGTQAIQESCTERARVAVKLLRSSPAALRPRAVAIASEATAEVGFVCNDQRQTAAAQSYYRLAAELAHESGDPLLESFVLGNWSDRLVEAGEADAALPMLDRAGRVALQRNAPATFRHLALVEAGAQASLGNADASLRALDRVDQARDLTNRTKDSSLLDWLNENVVGYSRGEILTDVGRLDDADALLSETLGNWRSPLRERSRALVPMARLRLRQGEVDEACRVAEEGLEAAVATSSPRTVHQIRNLRRELQPWSESPSVRSLDERMVAASQA